MTTTSDRPAGQDDANEEEVDEQHRLIVQIVCREGCLAAAHVVHCLLSLNRKERRKVMTALAEMGDSFGESMTELYGMLVERTMQGGKGGTANA